jgi:hypothetical protein
MKSKETHIHMIHHSLNLGGFVAFFHLIHFINGGGNIMHDFPNIIIKIIMNGIHP